MESVLPYVFAILPTVGVATLFYFVMKSILGGDRRERLAQARWEAEQDRRQATDGPAAKPRSARVDQPAVGNDRPAPPTNEH